MNAGVLGMLLVQWLTAKKQLNSMRDGFLKAEKAWDLEKPGA
jgi:hypothetical protein